MHEFWLHENGIEGAYVPLPARPHELSFALRGLAAAGFVGVNITVPHKESAFALADDHDAASLAVGAANILVFDGGRMRARNSDAGGLKDNLESELGPDAIRGETVVILGAGGAARAAILACDGLGAREVYLLNRTPAHSAEAIRFLAGRASAKLGVLAPDAWASAAPSTRLLVNATSLGMNGTISPALSLQLLPHGGAVCDLVYNPLKTPLLLRATELGLRTVDGLGMLVHQGAAAFEQFFGVKPRVSPALRTRLEELLCGGT
jgi:shikimate dehydrogenase